MQNRPVIRDYESHIGKIIVIHEIGQTAHIGTSAEERMPINVSLYRQLPCAARLFRALAALLAREPRGARSGVGISDSTIRHDIGLDGEHREYVSGRAVGQGSQRALHARAERIAAGLPD
jgi:hypothetical protein